MKSFILKSASLLPFVFVTILFAFWLSPLQAATCVWNASADGSWSSASNWTDCGGLTPQSGDAVVFNSTSNFNATIDTAFTIDSLTMDTSYIGTVTQSANLTITGNFTKSAGTYTHSSGTLTFDANGYSTIDVNAAQSFLNLTLTKTNGYTTTIASGDTITVTNTFLADGANNGINGSTLVLQNGGTFDGTTAGGNATIRVDAGTLTIDTTDRDVTLPHINLNGGNLAFTASNQTTFASLTVGNTSSTFTQGSGNIVITDTLTQSAGTITLASNSTTFTVTGAASLTGGTLDFGTSSANRTFSNNLTIDGCTLVATAYTGTMSVGALTGTSGTFKANGTAAAMTLSTTGAITIASAFSFNNGSNATSNDKMNFIFTENGYSTFDVDSTFTVYNLTLTKTNGYTTTIASGDTITVTNTFLADGANNGINGSTLVLQNGGTFDGTTGGGNATIRVDAGTLTIDTTDRDITLPHINLNGGNLAFTASNQTTFASLTVGNASSTFTGGSGNIVITDTLTQSAGTITLGSNSATFTVTGTSSLTGGTLDFGTATGNRTFSNTLTIDGGTLAATAYTGTITVAALAATSGTFKANNTAGAITVSTTGTITIASAFSFNNGSNATSNDKMNFIFTENGYSTFDVNSTFTVYNLTFTKTNGYTTTIASGDVITAKGTITFSTASNRVEAGDASSAIYAEGDVVVSDFFAGGSCPLSFKGTANQTFTLTGCTDCFNADITVNKSSGSVTLASALVMDASSQDLTIGSGTLDIAGYNLTVNGAGSTSTVSNGGILKLQGGETVSTPTLSSGSTVLYYGTSGYTLNNWSYQGLTLTPTGGTSTTYTLGATTTIAGDLSISTGAILSLNGKNLTLTGTLSNDGTFQLQGGETVSIGTMDTDSGTVKYVGTSTYSSLTMGSNYYSLAFSGSGGSWTLASALDVNGSLTISAGTLDSGSKAINVAGDWSNAGTFNAGTGTVTLDGTNQAITGNTTFYNLTKTVSSAATLSFAAGSTTTIGNDLTLQGTSGNLLSLRSSSTGTVFNLDPQGSLSTQYLDVKDSNDAGNPASCYTGCVDSGNNVAWYFSTGVTLSASSVSMTLGETGSYTVVLDSPPSAEVVITPDPSSGLSVSPTSLSFNSNNWDTPQTVTITATEAGSGSISHSAASSDSNYNNIGIGSVAVVVDGSPLLSIEISTPPGAVSVGGQADYTITVSNTGTDAEEDLEIEIMLPDNLSFVSATVSTAFSLNSSVLLSSASGTCSASGQTVNCNLGTLNAGFKISVALVTQVINSGSFELRVTAQGSNGGSTSGTSSAVTATGSNSNNFLQGSCTLYSGSGKFPVALNVFLLLCGILFMMKKRAGLKLP